MNTKFLFLCEILGGQFYIVSPEERNDEPKTFKSIKQKYKDINDQRRKEYLKNVELYNRKINAIKRKY